MAYEPQVSYSLPQPSQGEQVIVHSTICELGYETNLFFVGDGTLMEATAKAQHIP